MSNEPLTAELTPITDRERRLMDVIERQNAQMQELSAKLHDAESYAETASGMNTVRLKADMLDALRDIGNDDFDKEVIAHALIGFDYLLIKLAFREVDDNAT